jgi:dienelactone hydrolase
MSWKFAAGLVLVFLLGTVSANSQDQKLGDKPLPGDEMIYKYLCAQADNLSAKFIDGAQTVEEWQKKRPRLYEEYMDMLGLWPLPEKSPLKATITGHLEHEGVIIDKLHFQSKPGLYVTANLYRPKDPPAKKLPAIVYVCGHSNRGRDGNKSAYQDQGMWFATSGYVCIVLDTLQLGEIKGIHHGTYGLRETNPVQVRWWWHSAGYTPAGVECWNGVRAIDYLVSRDDVDADRIGVTGISGGGAATFWIAAADARVKVAVPVSGMSDLQSYVKDKIVNGHCDCMFLYNTHQWDWTTIAALVAPRPLLFANSDDDKIFPMDGNRRVMEKLRRIYTMYGKAKLVDEYISKGPHEYRPDLRIAAFRFLNKHLKNDTTTPVKDADFKTIPGKELRVFPTDADIPKDALNGKIDETFVPRAKVPLPEAGKFEAWKKELLTALRKTCFQAFPDEIPQAKMATTHGAVRNYWSTEPGIEVHGSGIVLNKKSTQTAEAPAIVFGPHAGGQQPDLKWLEQIPAPIGVALSPRGVAGGDGGQWTAKSPPNYVERSHALLGRTVDQGRVFDVISWMRSGSAGGKKSKIPIKLYGRGEAGIIAAYANLLQPGAAKEVVILDPPTSHQDGPHFLGVLRVLDIPEALGLLAPMPLTLINAQDPAFDRTAEIYKLAGAADKLSRK